MKKALALIVSLILRISLDMTTFAVESENKQGDELISLEEFRTLFPQVALSDDGYIVSKGGMLKKWAFHLWFYILSGG